MKTDNQQMPESLTVETDARQTTVAPDFDQLLQRDTRSTIGIGGRGLQFRTFEELDRFAQYIHSSGWAPKGVDTRAKIFLALELAMELEIPLLLGVQNTAVINGRPSLYGDIVLGICLATGKLVRKEVEYFGTFPNDDFGCRVTIQRAFRSPVVNEFTIGDAKYSKLWQNEGPWRTFPKRMLMWRPLSWGLRSEFADRLKGVSIAEDSDYDTSSAEALPSRPLPEIKRPEMPSTNIARAQVAEERQKRGPGRPRKTDEENAATTNLQPHDKAPESPAANAPAPAPDLGAAGRSGFETTKPVETPKDPAVNEPARAETSAPARAISTNALEIKARLSKTIFKESDIMGVMHRNALALKEQRIDECSETDLAVLLENWDQAVQSMQDRI